MGGGEQKRTTPSNFVLPCVYELMIGRTVTEARGMCLESKQPNACSSIPPNTDNINSTNSKHRQDAPGSLATEIT